MYIGADVVRVESLLARKTRLFPLSIQIDAFKITAFELINASTQNGNRVVVLRWPSWLGLGNHFGQFAFSYTIHPRRLDRANYVCLICAVIFFADFVSGKGGGCRGQQGLQVIQNGSSAISDCIWHRGVSRNNTTRETRHLP